MKGWRAATCRKKGSAFYWDADADNVLAYEADRNVTQGGGVASAWDDAKTGRSGQLITDFGNAGLAYAADIGDGKPGLTGGSAKSLSKLGYSPLDLSGAFTIMALVYVPTYTAVTGPFGYGDYTGNGRIVWYRDSSTTFLVQLAGSGTPHNVGSSITVSTSAWHIFIIRASSTQISTAVDAVPVSPSSGTTKSAGTINGASKLMVGTFVDSAIPFGTYDAYKFRALAGWSTDIASGGDTRIKAVRDDWAARYANVPTIP